MQRSKIERTSAPVAKGIANGQSKLLVFASLLAIMPLALTACTNHSNGAGPQPYSQGAYAQSEISCPPVSFQPVPPGTSCMISNDVFTMIDFTPDGCQIWQDTGGNQQLTCSRDGRDFHQRDGRRLHERHDHDEEAGR